MQWYLVRCFLDWYRISTNDSFSFFTCLNIVFRLISNQFSTDLEKVHPNNCSFYTYLCRISSTTAVLLMIRDLLSISFYRSFAKCTEIEAFTWLEPITLRTEISPKLRAHFIREKFGSIWPFNLITLLQSWASDSIWMIYLEREQQLIRLKKWALNLYSSGFLCVDWWYWSNNWD